MRIYLRRRRPVLEVIFADRRPLIGGANDLT